MLHFISIPLFDVIYTYSMQLLVTLWSHNLTNLIYGFNILLLNGSGVARGEQGERPHPLRHFPESRAFYMNIILTMENLWEICPSCINHTKVIEPKLLLIWHLYYASLNYSRSLAMTARSTRNLFQLNKHIFVCCYCTRVQSSNKNAVIVTYFIIVLILRNTW